ncbi:hypothetical protein [Pseudocitrobacter cyperus]|uniref:Uncharacterized protein n=1 Tax=Pseudocitrobacter cyperus TaxID=3112843 RepID=A0ABV0HH75_9ENTR
MIVEMFKEGASFEQRIDEINAILLLIQTNLKERHPEITLPAEQWCYVLLPGRIGGEQWDNLIAAGYCCLNHPEGYQFAIVLSAEELFSKVIISTLSIQNDFYYLIAFASTLPSNEGKLLQWIDRVLNNMLSDELPPFELLIFECGTLLLNG